MTIFYADDDLEEIEFFYEALKMINGSIHCITANDGEAALATLNSIDPPDLIFLDINMPKINGIECLVEIKKHKVLQSTPVVIYSTTSYKEEIDKLYRLGAHKFLTKQESIVQLSVQLSRIITSLPAIVP
jgi:CheY-like chemotaxis protein